MYVALSCDTDVVLGPGVWTKRDALIGVNGSLSGVRVLSCRPTMTVSYTPFARPLPGLSPVTCYCATNTVPDGLLRVLGVPNVLCCLDCSCLTYSRPYSFRGSLYLRQDNYTVHYSV